MPQPCNITITDRDNNPLNPAFLIDGQQIYIHLDYDHELYEFSYWVDGHGNTIVLSRATGFPPEEEVYEATVSCGQLYNCVMRKKPDMTCSVTLSVMLGSSVTADITDVGTATVTPEEYECGDTVTLLAEPSTCCTEFIRWSDGITAPQRQYTTMAGQHVDLTAVFDEKTFNISAYSIDSLDPNNGEVQIYTNTVKCGDTVVVEATPAEHYHFVGWFDMATGEAFEECDEAACTFTFTCSTPTSIRAYFEEDNSCTIFYHSTAQGCEDKFIQGHKVSSVNDVKFYDGDTYTVLGLTELSREEGYNPACYTMDGYIFLGWGLSSAASEPDYEAGDTITFQNTEENCEVHLYPIWRQEQLYSVRYNLDGGTGTNVPPVEEYYEGSDVILWDGQDLAKTDPAHPEIDYTPTGYFAIYNEDTDTFITNKAYSDTLTIATYNVEVRALWNTTPKEPIYVTYTNGGGSGSDYSPYPAFYETTTVILYYNADNHFTKEHHILIGWRNRSTGVFYSVGAMVSISETTIFDAVWQEKEYYTFFYHYNVQCEYENGSVFSTAGEKGSAKAYVGEPFQLMTSDEIGIYHVINRGWSNGGNVFEMGQQIASFDPSQFSTVMGSSIFMLLSYECEHMVSVTYVDEEGLCDLSALTQYTFRNEPLSFIQIMPSDCANATGRVFDKWVDHLSDACYRYSNTGHEDLCRTTITPDENITLYAQWKSSEPKMYIYKHTDCTEAQCDTMISSLDEISTTVEDKGNFRTTDYCVIYHEEDNPPLYKCYQGDAGMMCFKLTEIHDESESVFVYPWRTYELFGTGTQPTGDVYCDSTDTDPEHQALDFQATAIGTIRGDGDKYTVNRVIYGNGPYVHYEYWIQCPYVKVTLSDNVTRYFRVIDILTPSDKDSYEIPRITT